MSNISEQIHIDYEKQKYLVFKQKKNIFQVYIIEVSVGDHSWTVKHRYSDFHELHEKVSHVT